MSHVQDIDGEPRYYGRYAATVVDNADPLGLGRVRFRIEGLIEPSSGWAFPVGGSASSGTNQRGSWDVPDKGATVLASFLVGDIDQPLYEGAWRGTGETVTQAPGSSNASKVKIYETSTWLIVLSDLSGSESLSLIHKPSGHAIKIDSSSISIGDGSAQPSLLAQTYRTGESTMNNALANALTALASTLAGNPTTEPAAAAAAATLTPAIAAIQTFEGSATTYLSRLVKNS